MAIRPSLSQPMAYDHPLSQRSRWLYEYGQSLADQLRATQPAGAEYLVWHLNVLRRRVGYCIRTGNQVRLCHLLDALDDRLEPAERALRDALNPPDTRRHAA